MLSRRVPLSRASLADDNPVRPARGRSLWEALQACWCLGKSSCELAALATELRASTEAPARPDSNRRLAVYQTITRHVRPATFTCVLPPQTARGRAIRPASRGSSDGSKLMCAGYPGRRAAQRIARPRRYTSASPDHSRTNCAACCSWRAHFTTRRAALVKPIALECSRVRLRARARAPRVTCNRPDAYEIRPTCRARYRRAAATSSRSRALWRY